MDKSKRRILIIEDNEDIQQLYRYAFEESNYDVKISSNGLAGINDAVEYLPDIILLDIMMPEMNGFEFLEALTNNTSIKKRIPIIVLSNLTQEHEKEKALQNGADLYLIKSDYEGLDLVARVNKFLDNFKASEDDANDKE
ncbi:response regulator [Candidatus Saccharibacteria bacterium]|nr:response regulator [Candidatus Saccharibacteria bacterium]